MTLAWWRAIRKRGKKKEDTVVLRRWGWNLTQIRYLHFDHLLVYSLVQLIWFTEEELRSLKIETFVFLSRHLPPSVSWIQNNQPSPFSLAVVGVTNKMNASGAQKEPWCHHRFNWYNLRLANPPKMVILRVDHYFKAIAILLTFWRVSRFFRKLDQYHHGWECENVEIEIQLRLYIPTT